MLEKELSEKISAEVDKLFDHQIKFTQKLTRFPSLRGQEHTAQDFLFDEMTKRDYALDRWTVNVEDIKDHPGFSPVKVDYSNAINVVATHRPKKEIGKSLILNGHIDVVPEGPYEMWSRNPFDPAIEGDWMYGRGGADMKAGIVANIFAMDAIRNLGYQPAARVHIQSVVEEECTGNGALACLVRGYNAEAAIIPEPVDDKLVRGNVGVLWFKVRVKGLPVHVREAGAGQNAIEACFPVIKALRKLEEAWNVEKTNFKYYRDTEHPINFNVGKIKGGDWPSSVPSWCEFDCRIAIFPDWDPKEKSLEIENCIREASLNDAFLSNNPPQIEWNGFFAKGYVLEEGTEAEKVLGESHFLAYEGDMKSFISPAYLDARVFMVYGDCPCLVYGPYSENIHGFDERVSLSSVRKITKTIALFIADWCKLEKI